MPAGAEGFGSTASSFLFVGLPWQQEAGSRGERWLQRKGSLEGKKSRNQGAGGECHPYTCPVCFNQQALLFGLQELKGLPNGSIQWLHNYEDEWPEWVVVGCCCWESQKFSRSLLLRMTPFLFADLHISMATCMTIACLFFTTLLEHLAQHLTQNSKSINTVG